MSQLSFTKAVVQAFQKEDISLDNGLLDESIVNDIPRDIHIDNAQPIFARLRDILHNALNQVRGDAIALSDLRRLRIQFYEARDQFFLLEEKEQEDVKEMERNTKWHERSKLVRVFVSSETGEQLDREREEAKLASSIANNFAQHLKDLEEAIDQHILFIGDKHIPTFHEKIVLWRQIGNIKQNSQLARDRIRNTYHRISQGSCSSCGNSIAWSTKGSKSELSSADKNLSDQLRLLSPWYDQLTKEVESTIDRVRDQLMISLSA